MFMGLLFATYMFTASQHNVRYQQGLVIDETVKTEYYFQGKYIRPSNKVRCERSREGFIKDKSFSVSECKKVDDRG